MDTWKEWQIRRHVLDEALRTLADGKRRKGRQIARELNQRGIQVNKSLVNSVLFSEGRRYVTYDKRSYTYRIKGEPFIVSDTRETVDGSQFSQLDVSSVEHQRHYVFRSEYTDSGAFFRSEAKGGKTLIVLNNEHPLNQRLATLTATSKMESHTLYTKLKEAAECIRLLLKAWADYENEQPGGKRKHLAQEARIDWGRKLRDLLID